MRDHTSGSGDAFIDRTVAGFRRCRTAPAGAPVGPGPAEAEADLNAALLEATTALTRLDVAQWRPELAGALAALRRPDNGTELPPGYDPRARRLFARASVLDRVLAPGRGERAGRRDQQLRGAPRDEVLRPLVTACRRALIAACNAPLI